MTLFCKWLLNVCFIFLLGNKIIKNTNEKYKELLSAFSQIFTHFYLEHSCIVFPSNEGRNKTQHTTEDTINNKNTRAQWLQIIIITLNIIGDNFPIKDIGLCMAQLTKLIFIISTRNSALKIVTTLERNDG